VFLNNVGRQVDPAITSALELSLDALGDEAVCANENRFLRGAGAPAEAAGRLSAGLLLHEEAGALPSSSWRVSP